MLRRSSRLYPPHLHNSPDPADIDAAKRRTSRAPFGSKGMLARVNKARAAAGKGPLNADPNW